MQITWNQQLVKKENKAIVLNLIMQNSPISRADAAQMSGLNKGTVSSLVSELLEEQLIYESGPGESSGGRRPVLLLFNQKAGYSIGIDLGVNYIFGVLTDLQGEIVVEKSVVNNHPEYSNTLEQVNKVINALIKAAPPSPYGVVGIGIGAPGVVNKEGVILLAPNLGWKNVSLKKDIESTFNIPVIVENEANAGAYGEKRYGVGKEFDNLIYVSVGIGIGSGIILNGELYKGINGYSGEVGHMSIDVNGPRCRCGNFGCWELYASEKALLNKAKEIGLDLKENHTLSDIIDLARNENPAALALLKEIGKKLGQGMINIIHTFNPQQIIIGNKLAAVQTWIAPYVQEVIDEYTLPYHQMDIQVNFSDLSLPASALGVAAFTTENFLKSQLQVQ
ncbi:ROK family transcriptional regulator [Mesobacillus maritimus]|uniref:ROK family transcriptional regulator n=1 Tax=Mesobacillus maritimus TaxID=1643336 RepID=A0ABS7K3N3_9BACI|nr:ROK family transcriptional regulator [Mesobacillus maritimus]MBY0096877.1 ROK family transcriptional regulator [Mesobacillus maritimus]